VRAWHVARRMARFVLSNLGRASERGRGGDLFSFGNIQRGKASQAITGRQGLTARLSPPTHARARGGRTERAAARLPWPRASAPPAPGRSISPRTSLSLLYQPPARTLSAESASQGGAPHARPHLCPYSLGGRRRRLHVDQEVQVPIALEVHVPASARPSTRCAHRIRVGGVGHAK